MLRTHNNTDGNKLVIFSSVALYYGDTYIVIVRCLCSIVNNEILYKQWSLSSKQMLSSVIYMW